MPYQCARYAILSEVEFYPWHEATCSRQCLLALQSNVVPAAVMTPDELPRSEPEASSTVFLTLRLSRDNSASSSSTKRMLEISDKVKEARNRVSNRTQRLLQRRNVTQQLVGPW